MRELEDERPIPLRRAGAAAVGCQADSDVGGNRSLVGNGCPAPAERATAWPAPADADRPFVAVPPPQPAPTSAPPHIERTRPDDSATSLAAVYAVHAPLAAAVVEPAAVAPTVVMPAVAEPVATEPATLTLADEHELAALCHFRMDVELVEPFHRPWWRLLVRFFVVYVLVIGSVLVLISLFVAFVAQVGSGHP